MKVKISQLVESARALSALSQLTGLKGRPLLLMGRLVKIAKTELENHSDAQQKVAEHSGLFAAAGTLKPEFLKPGIDPKEAKKTDLSDLGLAKFKEHEAQLKEMGQSQIEILYEPIPLAELGDEVIAQISVGDMADMGWAFQDPPAA